MPFVSRSSVEGGMRNLEAIRSNSWEIAEVKSPGGFIDNSRIMRDSDNDSDSDRLSNGIGGGAGAFGS
jgi:hypothetical protein